MGEDARLRRLNRELERAFPGLRNSHYAITSPPTPEYNCIAYAAGDKNNNWWPNKDDYWAPDIPKKADPENFISLFELQGYTVTDNPNPVQGEQKIALYVGKDGKVRHAALQLSSGMWSSKLGSEVDIAHDLGALEGKTYGKVRIILKK